MAIADDLDLGRYKLGWSDEENYVYKPKKGLSEEIVREMSWMKGEPDWMLKNRLKALKHFQQRPMPTWGGDLSEIDFDDIYYYIKPTDQQVDEWEALPESIKRTYERLGIPEAERKYLAGRSEEHTSELQSRENLVCRLLLEKKKKKGKERGTTIGWKRPVGSEVGVRQPIPARTARRRTLITSTGPGTADLARGADDVEPLLI